MKAPQFKLSSKVLATASAVAALTALTAVGVHHAPAHAQAKPAASAASAPKAALTVSVTLPQTTSVNNSVSANGSVAPWQEVAVSAEAQGLRLVELRANVGDFVKRGQVLATFATETVQAELAQARAGVLEAQTGAALAKSDADRARSLQATGALSAQQIAQLLSAEQSSQARVAAQQAMLQSVQLRLKQATVIAPDSGIVTMRPGVVGAVLPAGAELFRLIRQGRLEWRAEVTSAELGRIKAGAPVEVTAASGVKVQGKVRLVGPTVDLQTRNSLVYVDLPANEGIKAGMYAKGQFNLGSNQALTLPQQALVLRDGFTYAMRVDANNKVTQVKLQTGKRSGDVVEIIAGAKTDEKFVAAGAAFLADGDIVNVVAAAAAATK
jgi:RND family efflux transporter MFP subunit